MVVRGTVEGLGFSEHTPWHLLANGWFCTRLLFEIVCECLGEGVCLVAIFSFFLFVSSCLR